MILKIKNLLSLNTTKITNKINYIQSLFSVYFCISSVAIIFGIILNLVLSVNMNQNIDVGQLSTENIMWSFSGSVLITPLIEELAFRLTLANSYIKQIIGIYVLIFGFLLFANASLAIEFVVLLLLGLIFIYQQFLKNEPPLFTVNWKTILIFNILFTLTHIIKNFQIFGIYDWRLLLILPISVIPQFIFGIVLSLVRIRINLWNAIVIHIFNNFLSFAPVLILFIPSLEDNFKNLISSSFLVFILICCVIFIFSKEFCKYQQDFKSTVV